MMRCRLSMACMYAFVGMQIVYTCSITRVDDVTEHALGITCCQLYNGVCSNCYISVHGCNVQENMLLLPEGLFACAIQQTQL
jgi:hypothetical protein